MSVLPNPFAPIVGELVSCGGEQDRSRHALKPATVGTIPAIERQSGATSESDPQESTFILDEDKFMRAMGCDGPSSDFINQLQAWGGK